MLRSLVVFIFLAALQACGGPARRPSVVPTESVLALDEAAPRVSIRALWVTYVGAERAGDGVTRTRDQARERAQMLAATARGEDEDFWSLVRRYGDRPPLSEGGAVGRTIMSGDGTLPPEAEKVAFRLQVGQVSDPVETREGFVVVFRTKDPSDRPSQVAAKHILISYKGAQHAGPRITRSKEEARQRAQEVYEQVRAPDANWDAIAQEYTDEPGAHNGGDLGVFGPGQMVPSFERAAFALDIGEVSEPVESPFGFHVIRRYK